MSLQGEWAVRRGGRAGGYLGKRLELGNRGRLGNVRETKRWKLEGNAAPRRELVGGGQSKPGERKEGKGSSVAGSGDLARRPATAGGELKRQYRRKLIIGVRCTREENKIQASSDCCFQLNPSCATLST